MMIETYQHCQLCPRACGVDRTQHIGFCGETAQIRIASFSAHFGEEPCISGTKGSGTIFLAGCSCQCFFCQNHQISHRGLGAPYSCDELFRHCLHLIEQGVHNLNFVTPDHFEPHLRELALRLRAAGHTLPLVWNGSGYHTIETIERAGHYIDIFLPDFKFADPNLAQLCINDRRYPEIALRALTVMIEKKGFLFPWSADPSETAREGVMVRHLVLPGHVDNSIRILELLHREFGRHLPLSVMSQFTPVDACFQRHLLDRQLSTEEYNDVCQVAEELGFEALFIQENNGDPNFMPDFSCQERPFIGNPPTSEN